MSQLPPPDRDQLEVSHRLSRRIAAAIASAGGWIGFDDWMGRALYEPGLGYYSGGSRKFGAAGDFVTAPEMSPLFGRCVAAQLAQWFGQGAPETVFEFGAGSGVLAATLLQALDEQGFGDVRYRIVELSGELRERQRTTLAERAPQALARVSWLDELPGRIEGVVLGNELLDAMPVRLFRLAGGQVFERGVVQRPGSGEGGDRDGDIDGGGGGGGDGYGYDGAATGASRELGDVAPSAFTFAFADRPADPAFATAVRRVLDEAGWASQGGWPDGYASEFGEQAAAWVESVGRRLAHGALLLIDYGFPSAEFYHPQRDQGTLICHYRHRAHHDPLWLPGVQDISAHVDFSGVEMAARRAGLDALGYCSQARFLIGCGLLDLAAQLPRDDALDWARQASALQQLMSESEMGELVKAIAYGRGLPDEAIGFAHGDRRATLASSAGSDVEARR